MSKRASRAHWRARGGGDSYSRAAASRGLGSRAWFKLEALDRRFGLLRPGMKVLELGAAPGGWTRYLANSGAHTFACDERDTDVPDGVEFLHGSVGDDAFRDFSERNAPYDLIVSDMAPNMSGIAARDMVRAEALVELACDASDTLLAQGGGLVVKLFQGDPLACFRRRTKSRFRQVRIAKPSASRAESSETYGVALDREID